MLQGGIFVLVVLVIAGAVFAHQLLQSHNNLYRQTTQNLSSISSANTPQVDAAREAIYVKFVHQNVMDKLLQVAQEIDTAKSLRAEKRYSDADIHTRQARTLVYSIQTSLMQVTNVPAKYQNAEQHFLEGLEDYAKAFSFTTEGSDDPLVFTETGKYFLNEGNKTILSIFHTAPELNIPQEE